MRTRIERLRESLDPNQSFFTDNLIHIRYLSGFTGSNAALLVNPDEAHLFTDSRYDIQSRHETNGFFIHIVQNFFHDLKKSVNTESVVIETHHLHVGTYRTLEKELVGIKLIESTGIVEKLRIIKDSIELKHIDRACNIATQALSATIAKVRAGMTEREIAIQLERSMIDFGADERAFDTIVASGENSAIPHHQPTFRELRNGDLLKIDFGAKVNGYHSDCTRTFVIGKPQDWQREIFEAVVDAQRVGREALRSGVTCSSITDAVRKSLSDTSFAEKFTHGLGHGVGLEIHEDPYLSTQSTGTLEAGTVVTVEPGVYLENLGGVRIEDTIEITLDGYRNLTEFHYDLQQIG